MTQTEEPTSADSNGNGAVAADLEVLKKSFAQLRTDLTSIVSNALGVGKSGAHLVKEQAAEAVDGVKNKLHSIKDKGVHSAEAIENKIADHPITSILVAFGVGFMLARMFNRK